ncbi:hypothetical protein ACLOJK_023153 [Asimina triloba]
MSIIPVAAAPASAHLRSGSVRHHPQRQQPAPKSSPAKSACPFAHPVASRPCLDLPLISSAPACLSSSTSQLPIGLKAVGFFFAETHLFTDLSAYGTSKKQRPARIRRSPAPASPPIIHSPSLSGQCPPDLLQICIQRFASRRRKTQQVRHRHLETHLALGQICLSRGVRRPAADRPSLAVRCTTAIRPSQHPPSSSASALHCSSVVSVRRCLSAAASPLAVCCPSMPVRRLPPAAAALAASGVFSFLGKKVEHPAPYYGAPAAHRIFNAPSGIIRYSDSV